MLGPLIAAVSLVVRHRFYVHKLQKLQPVGLVSLRHVESSWTRDRVLCIGRQILIHCITRQVQSVSLKPVSACEFGEGNGTPLQYSCLENPMDGGA